MITLLYIAIGLQALDFYTTYRGITSGKAHEANPLIIWVIKRLGLVPTLLLTKIAAVAMVISMYASYPLVLLPIIALYGYVVYNNFKIVK